MISKQSKSNMMISGNILKLKEMVLKFHGEFRPYHQEYGKKQYLFHRCLTDTASNNINLYCKYIELLQHGSIGL